MRSPLAGSKFDYAQSAGANQLHLAIGDVAEANRLSQQMPLGLGAPLLQAPTAQLQGVQQALPTDLEEKLDYISNQLARVDRNVKCLALTDGANLAL